MRNVGIGPLIKGQSFTRGSVKKISFLISRRVPRTATERSTHLELVRFCFNAGCQKRACLPS